MNEEIKSNYYAVIPATVRYDKGLKPSEKLLYGEITSLANKYGYCFAQNRYFSDLYGVSIETVSRWCSHLQELGYVEIFIDRNEKNEIVARRIFIKDTPYCLKNQYPTRQKDQYPIDENVKDNNMNINMIDDIYYKILKREKTISVHFYKILDILDILYDEKSITILSEDNKQMMKDIFFTLYDIYNSSFKFILKELKRQEIIKMYIECRDKKIKYKNTEYKIKDFIKYFRKCLINKYNSS